VNDINPKQVDIDGATRMSEAGKSDQGDTTAPAVAKPATVVPPAWRFSFWTRGWIPGGWDGPF
jgi:hypothetical protein